MKIEYTGRHVQVTSALKSHVERELGRIENLLRGRHLEIEVLFSVEKERTRAEIILICDRNRYTAHATLGDMYQAASLAVARLERQVLTRKSKKRAGLRNIKHERSPKGRITRIDSMNADGIVFEKRRATKQFSLSEAAHELSEKQIGFLFFIDSESNELNFLYRRRDGRLGCLRPG
jgi:putative sigma-54 modulation protein